MSQKKRKHLETGTPEMKPPDVPQGPEYLRRGLLGLVTALLVARPLVLAEDPGMLQPETDTSFLILTLFWFIAGLGWAVWRYWSGKTAWHGGIVEAALLAASVIVAASTRAASYKHPALLVAWEWFALVLALFLMRQLATTESDRRHLLAAFLASAVSISAVAIYQYNVEIPKLRNEYAAREPAPVALSQFQVASQAVGLFGNSTAGQLPVLPLLYRMNLERYESTAHDTEERIARRLQEELNAHGTFARSSSFASYLVLFVPALFVAVHLRYRSPQARWQLTAAALCCLVVMLALFLTHSHGAILGLALAGLVAVAVAVHRRTIPGKVALILAALGCALILLLQTGALQGIMGKTTETERQRPDYWVSTWQMIRKHLWLGVGAGNFGREYPRYMEADAYAPLSEPHNFALEMWATYGLFSLLAIFVAFGGFFWLVLRQASRGRQPPVNPPPGADAPGSPEATRWDFYLWGVAGLLLSFVLQQTGHSPEMVLADRTPTGYELLKASRVAIIQAVIWFAAFALFAGVQWSNRMLAGALATGVLAMLLNLCVSGGISFPSVATPLWLVVGLALAALELPPWTPQSDSWVVRALPLPLALGFLMAYVTSLFDPVVSGMSLARTSAREARTLLQDQSSEKPTIRDGRKYMIDNVVQPMLSAVKEDPGNARWQVQLSSFYEQLARARWRDPKQGLVSSQAAVVAALDAKRLDPHGLQGYRALLDVHLLLAEKEQKPEGKRTLYLQAAQDLRQMALLDPTDPWLHFRLARTLFDAGKIGEAIEAAQTAQSLDSQQPHSPRRLGEWQRLLLRQWLEPLSLVR